MSFWRNLLCRLVREPRGHAADGRRLGLATAAAVDAQRRAALAEATESRRQLATAVAIDCRHRMAQPEHGHHPG